MRRAEVRGQRAEVKENFLTPFGNYFNKKLLFACEKLPYLCPLPSALCNKKSEL